MVAIRRRQIHELVSVAVGESHPAVRVTAHFDDPRGRERAVSNPFEHPDRFTRPVIDEEIRVSVAINVAEPYGVRMW